MMIINLFINLITFIVFGYLIGRLKPDFSIALIINLIAASLLCKFGANPPSSPTEVASPLFLRTDFRW